MDYSQRDVSFCQRYSTTEGVVALVSYAQASPLILHRVTDISIIQTRYKMIMQTLIPQASSITQSHDHI